MRPNVDVSAVLVALIVAVLLFQANHTEAQANKPVKVDAKCPKHDDGRFSITVDPFEVEVQPGEGVEWKLYTDNQKNEDILISAKDPQNWLYTDVTAKGNKKVVMTEMAPGSANKTYDYKITVYCGDNSEPVVLDPRIRVGGG